MKITEADAMTLAVEIVQSFCDNISDCNFCPFNNRKEDECAISEISDKWQDHIEQLFGKEQENE